MTVRRKQKEAAPDEVCENPRHRLCAATRRPRPIDELIRLVEGPDGALVADLKNKLPGRGVWVTADRASIDQAIKTKACQKSLKRPVTIDPRMPDIIEGLLWKSALDALSFANKAGALVLGFERVLAALDSGKIAAVIHASDAGADGLRKLESARSRVETTDLPIKSIDCFSNEQLSLALGRPNVVHAALFDAPAARNFIEQTERLLRFRLGFGFANGPAMGLKDGTIRHE